jgi:hypothetical protein
MFRTRHLGHHQVYRMFIRIQVGQFGHNTAVFCDCPIPSIYIRIQVGQFGHNTAVFCDCPIPSIYIRIQVGQFGHNTAVFCDCPIPSIYIFCQHSGDEQVKDYPLLYPYIPYKPSLYVVFFSPVLTRPS